MSADNVSGPRELLITTSELLQAHLPTSKVVKAFNHIYAADLTTHGQPTGAKNRRALVIAGDDKDAKARVTHLLDQFGFDTVDAGPLREGWRIQRDTPGYGRKRRSAMLIRRVAMGYFRLYAPQQKPDLFNHLVGALDLLRSP